MNFPEGLMVELRAGGNCSSCEEDVMEHRRLAELNVIADLKPLARMKVMSRRERLDRWAELLEQAPDRLVTTLEEIEWKPDAERRAMRADGSALTIAFSDPELRSAGLQGDRLGDAIDFFELSDQDAHIVFCSCHGGAVMRSEDAARRVRGIRSRSLWPLYFGWFR
jgi:hypothetical protein